MRKCKLEWTDEELGWMASIYPKGDLTELARKIDVSIAVIHRKAHRMGLVRDPETLRMMILERNKNNARIREAKRTVIKKEKKKSLAQQMREIEDRLSMPGLSVREMDDLCRQRSLLAYRIDKESADQYVNYDNAK